MNDQKVTKCNSCGGWVPVSEEHGIEGDPYHDYQKFAIKDAKGGGFLLRSKEDTLVKYYLSFDSKEGDAVFTTNVYRGIRISREKDAKDLASYLKKFGSSLHSNLVVEKREPDYDLTSIGV